MKVPRWLVSACLPLLAAPAAADRQPDPELLAEVRAIRAIDNHAHLPPVSPPGVVTLPADGSLGKTPFPYPTRLRVDNQEWMRAWEGLYGVDAKDMTTATATRVLRRKHELMRERGEGWAESILDAVSIEVALLNTKGRGRGQPAARFGWVPHGNDLIAPFGDGQNAPPGPLPATLAAYEAEVLRPTVRRWKQEGAAAVKLSSAYRRSLDFAPVDPAEAARLYAAHAGSAATSPDHRRTIENHLFRVLCREAGAAGLVMHIHTGIGADPWFRLAGANPLLLEDAVTDPALRGTRFVLVHGGWPFDREAGAMLIKPNVWADFSAHTFLRSPRDLARTLRDWLEWYPEKVLFGSDAYADPATPLAGWEEMLWLANASAREALSIALTGMMDDGLITRARAGEMARMVLRENARGLYGAGAP